MKRMIRWSLVLAFVMPLFAQDRALVSEAMSVTGSVTAFAAPTLAAIQKPNARCIGILEIAPIRFTEDGTTPSSTVGSPVAVGAELTVEGYANVANWKAIRTAGTSGAIFWNCY